METTLKDIPEGEEFNSLRTSVSENITEKKQRLQLAKPEGIRLENAKAALARAVERKEEADEAMDLVPCDEAAGNAFAVLPEPLRKVGCDPDIERSTRLAREDVDAGFAFERHPPVIAAHWMLKQVQHDGMGAV